MTIKTYTEQLEEVQAAISDILTGAQSVTYKDKSVDRANLRTLYDMEKRLRIMVKRETTGGIPVYGGTPVDS